MAIHLRGRHRLENHPTWEESFGMEYDALRPGTPEGLRVQIYNEDGSNSVVNVAPEGDIVQMSPGEHSLLLYNNDTEYIVFDDMQSYSRARATTRTRSRSSYMGNSYMEDNDENTVNAPDMLYGNYMESYTAERKTETDLLSVTMHPLVLPIWYVTSSVTGWNTWHWHGAHCPAWPKPCG